MLNVFLRTIDTKHTFQSNVVLTFVAQQGESGAVVDNVRPLWGKAFEKRQWVQWIVEEMMITVCA